MIDAYGDEALRMARIAFSNWHRERAAPSFGCFDRQFWGWKKKDFADATLQAAVTLVVRLAEVEGSTSSLPLLLEGYVGYLERIQHRDGSFDQIYPYERAPGVVHDLLSPLTWLWGTPYLGERVRARLETVIHRGAAYALGSDESHGEIANHFAGYAWELIHYGRVFANAAAVRRGQEYLERTLRLFNDKEGWFREYEGADAGYQTRLLAFLTRIAELTEDKNLWVICEKASRFVEYLLMPDDALHPMLGVRSTALIYSSGFERLAARSPEFAPLAERIHSSWAAGTAPLASLIDFENGIRLAEDAFAASELRNKRIAESTEASPSAAVAAEPFDLTEAGLHRRVMVEAGTPSRVLYVASKLGGTVVVYGRSNGSGWRVEYEDSGYLLHLASGDSCWVVRRAEAGRLIEKFQDRLVVESTFERSLHDDLTPLRMILLRILNLTVLRSQKIGDLFRKVIVRRLIAGRESLPLRLRREIAIVGHKVAITDRFAADGDLSARLAGARLFRCRRTVGTHMASSRYFQPQELVGDQPWLEELPLEALDGRSLNKSSS